MIPINLNDRFKFNCHPGVACFNACCRDLNQFLFPYDILRLRSHLNLTSQAFLEHYTSCHTGPETGLPVVTLRPQMNADRTCPFVSAKGCRVYTARPASCRIYPLARAISRDRQSGQVREHFAMLKEPHCLGHHEDHHHTVSQWIASQELEEFNRINDQMMALISFKRQYHPDPLDLVNTRLFYLACYDLDSFREKVLSGEKRFIGHRLDQGTRSRLEKEDQSLLAFGIQWAQSRLMALTRA